MVEGGGSKTFGHIKRMMYESPRELHRLLELLAKATILYLNAQIAAGAQAIMLFDTWGGVLTPAQYEEFSLRHMAQVVDAVDAKIGGTPGSQYRLHQGRRSLAGKNRGASAAMPSASIGPPT